MRRRVARPRWIEEAVYGGPCLNCVARIEPGERFLYFPDKRLMCALCGEKYEADKREAARRAREAAIRAGLNVREVYDGSDGALTRRLLAELVKRGPAGRVAALLFRAQKSSRRAKLYGRTSYRDLSYDRKGESLRELTEALAEHGAALGFVFGWGRDDSSMNPWVLYVELPRDDSGEVLQVSFHSPERYAGPDYPGQWDGRRVSEERIIAFCQRVIARTEAYGLYIRGS